jgi:hypothetical protein
MVHCNKSGKRNGEVIPQGPFRNVLIVFSFEDLFKLTAGLFLFCRKVQTVIEDFENKPVTFFPIFAHQGLEVFHGRRFKRLKPVQFKNVSEGIEDELPLAHYFRRKVTGSLRKRGFCCPGFCVFFFFAFGHEG